MLKERDFDSEEDYTSYNGVTRPRCIGMTICVGPNYENVKLKQCLCGMRIRFNFCYEYDVR